MTVRLRVWPVTAYAFWLLTLESVVTSFFPQKRKVTGSLDVSALSYICLQCTYSNLVSSAFCEVCGAEPPFPKVSPSIGTIAVRNRIDHCASDDDLGNSLTYICLGQIGLRFMFNSQVNPFLLL